MPVRLDGLDIKDCFHADIVGALVVCDESVVEGSSYTNGEFTPPSIPAVDLVAYAAAKRYSIETGGFSYQGHEVATDSDSQSKIGNGALAATVIGSTFTTKWKGSDGRFFTLNQQAMIAMATAGHAG